MAIGLIIAAWSTVRFVVWESPILPDLPDISPQFATAQSDTSAPNPIADTPQEVAAESATTERAVAFLDTWQPASVADRPPAMTNEEFLRPDAFEPVLPAPRLERGYGQTLGHANLLRMGYYVRSNMDESAATGASARITVVSPVNAQAAARELRANPAPSRWSIDAWALWREGGPAQLAVPQPSYGRSQAGAVLRYSLAPRSTHAPQLYVRGTSALDGGRERDFALGTSARPLPALPLRLAAEGRVSETENGTEVRAAAFAVTEFPPLELPLGLSGEAYAQAGYVTGQFATPFVDGQARVTMPIVRQDDFRLEAGGGAWGGAQDDAARLDMGPSAGVTFRIGPARGRVSADYRIRVAGDAEPESGPALTITAGF